MSHIHKDIQGARLKKWHRMCVRFAVSIVIVCLPLARRLNSLQLLATVTGLLLLDLVVELYGLTQVGESFFGRRGKKCAYWADCSMRKHELEQAVKTGEPVTIEAFVNKGDGEKAHFETS